LISSPLVLASSTFAPKAWRKFSDIPALRSIKTIRGTVDRIDSKLRRATIIEAEGGSSLEASYDFFVGASGLRRAWPVVPQSVTKEAYLSEALRHINLVKSATEGVAVVGGGNTSLT